MDFEKFKKLTMVRSFVRLYQYYFRLYLIAKGYFSKNLPYRTFHEICRRFCEIIQFPLETLQGLQVGEIDLDKIEIINTEMLELMSQISEDDMINAFSQLTILEIH
ncbi:MAG: hypothetical protein ACW98D_07490 [Promethearchaeota archaeon]